MRDGVEGPDIARRFFSESEVDALEAVPEDARKAAFFLCWTRKEAYIKARGDGLFCSLDSFDVSLDPSKPAALLATRAEADAAQRWTLIDIGVEPGYAAAIAAEGVGWTLTTVHADLLQESCE
jgi:4'-phosphopantetheinyl transferase